MTADVSSRDVEQVSFQKILFCTDFSENADFAFSFAVDSASKRPGSILYLLHVVPESSSQFWKSYIYEVDNVDTKAKKDIDERIERSYTSRLPAGVTMEVVMKVGKEDQEILQFAHENDVDLIVMGRQGHSTFQKVLFGKVTETVVRKADCAVLVIPMDYQKRKV